MPHLLALRAPLPFESDYAMTVGQIGLFLGISVSITIRIKSNADFVESYLSEKKRTKAVAGIIKFFCALLPLLVALAVEKEVLGLISTFASLLCPYFIIIVPGTFSNSKLG